MKKNSTRTKSKQNHVSALILADHKEIKELIGVLKDPEVTFAKKKPAYKKFERALSSHSKAEEESLYVSLKEVEDLRMDGLEGETEHAIADRLMREISEGIGDEDQWMAKVKVLAEVVDHHIKEEEKDVLKAVRAEFPLDKRVEIGNHYSQLMDHYRTESRQTKQRFEYGNDQVSNV